MAIFHASIKTYSRSKGHSSVAAAAYRAGLALLDERTGQRHDYRVKQGVERFCVLVPDGVPAWARNPSRLWNAAEAVEVRVNACVARELIVALPHELDAAARALLAEDIGRALVTRYRVGVMVAVHGPDRSGDTRNHHAHLLFSTRSLGASGFAAKVRALDDRRQGPKEVKALRETVANLSNAALAANGKTDRVDHRSLAVQASIAESRGDYEAAALLTREPTIHVGRAGVAVVRKGGFDERAADNAERIAGNRVVLAAYLHQHANGVSPRRKRASGQSLRQGARRSGAAPSLVLGGPTRGARATGRDAELLNAQAAVWEEGVRVEREASQAYLDGLRRSAEQSAAMVDAYLAAIGRPNERPRLLEQCARDPAWVERLRRSLEARAELRALGEELPRRRRQYGQAMMATVEAERALEALETARPPAWQPLTRRQWAQKRRAERVRLLNVREAEAAARSLASGEGARKLKERVLGLRGEIRRIERERRACSKGAAKNGSSLAVRTPVAVPRKTRTVSSRLTP